MAIRKIINDPVHGFITINDELILQIIEHTFYQRLRRIKQMALAFLVYPGAVHTRFHHSLGAYHLMCNALEELSQKGTEISLEEKQAAKIAILLHDIGHGPFSHALEQTILPMHHEEISLLLMEKLNQEFDGKLDLAIKIFKGETEKKFLHQLVSSQLDVDRLDYLARDSFFSGVSEGVIGYDRIIKMIAVKNNNLVVEEKGIHSIEKFLIARRLMYWQVYLHKTVLSAEILMCNILLRAKEIYTNTSLFTTPALKFFLENNLNKNEFENNEIAINHFINLDDTDISVAIKTWQHHEDIILSDLCKMLLGRNLYKTEFYTSPVDEIFLTKQKELQNKYNISAENLKYYCSQSSTSNLFYSQVNENINIMFKDGSIKDISMVDYSLIHEAIPVKKYYICYKK